MCVQSDAANNTECQCTGSPEQNDATERSRISPSAPEDGTEGSRISSTAPDNATERSRISPTAPDDVTERHQFGPPAHDSTKRKRIGPPTPDGTMKLRCVGPSAPDGGWGWVIVICATVLNFLIGGAVNSFGVIYVELLDVFQESSGKTAWVGSMANAMGLLLGPVSSALSSRFSCRTMVVVGGVLTAAGWALTGLMPRLEYMFLTYGLLAGIGKSLAYTPSIVILGQWFRRRHSLATGIAVAGAGIGTFAFAPVLEMLFKHVEFKYTMFIMAGVMVNISICGLFFRDVPNDKSAFTIDEDKERANDIYFIETVTNEQSRTESDYCDEQDMQTKNANEQSRNESDTCYEQDKQRKITNEQCRNESDYCDEQDMQGKTRNEQCRNESDYCDEQDKQRKITNEQCRNESDYCDEQDMQRKNANDTRYEQTSGNSTFVQNGFREYLDYTLLKRPLFLCFGVSVMLATCGHSPATVMLPPLAIEHHVTPQRAAFLLSITGIADIVGRLAFGFLCDIDILRNNRKYLYMASIFISGIANITCGFSTQYWQFATYSVIFGLFAGSYNALTPVILVDLLGSGKLASSFGLALLFQGTGFLLGPPMAGWIRDALGNYQSAFHFAGISMLASSFVMGLSALCDCKRRKKHTKDVEIFSEPSGNVQLVGVFNVGFTAVVDENSSKVNQ
ncbi:monocarboxylate transporter 12-like isoform X1 [Mya arenaria]|uniref:monocarboxylate transporter 12-like isoform X1 n=1 Tax=Mya arenaria TaxID=6604 RepID=UPI0022E4DB15|nr:monocarboxylate transporter 12-like isoform X1 [Mya arenaria]